MILTAATPRTTPGPKALGLFRLREAGVRVPDFVVMPAETFDPVLSRLPGTDDAALDRRQRALDTFTLPENDQADLARVLATWGFPRQAVVVRSSVADEDGSRASFAGMMDSFLHLTALPDVLRAIARCAASAYSPRARAYRRQRGLSPLARPAVIVQRQVEARASGVAFSTFPEFPQETAVHAVWGFGEGLVGGLFSPDEFYVEKTTGRLVHEVLAHKSARFAPAPGGSGLRQVPVAADEQRVACLTPAQQAEVARTAQALERAFGQPQDVEFVVEAQTGLVWFVQARPLTQPIPEVVVYDNSNIQESYCGVTTPLTFSFAQRAYATVYRQTMRVLGLPEARIRAMEPVVTNLLGLVRGRIYYHINHWYRGLQLLPGFRQNKADMERMMGLDEPVDFVTDREKTALEKLRLLPGLLLNLARLLGAFARLPRSAAAFQARFGEEFRRFYAQPFAAPLAFPSEVSFVEPSGRENPLQGAGGEVLLREKARLDERLLQNWTVPIVNDFYVMMTNGRVARGLKRAGFAQPEEFLSRYLAGDQRLASTQPTDHLRALARRAGADAALLRLLETAPPDDLPDRVRRQAPAFHRQVADFLDQYGDRTVGELKLETETMRVNPAVFYNYLRNFLGENPGAPAAPATSLRDAARHELHERLARHGFWFRRRLRADLRRLQTAIRTREALRLERTRLFGMYRTLYRAMGRWLVGQGWLDAETDAFFLTETELTEALARPNPALRALVAGRRDEFARYADETVPSRVILPSRPTHAPPPMRADTLRGTGCYPGVAEGRVLVVTSPDGDLDVRGRIVCALRTDPGWAALFPACRGVVIEKGSALSHSVILLRELGIPTVVNVPGLTRQFRTGERLRLDGGTGEITRLPDETP